MAKKRKKYTAHRRNQDGQPGTLELRNPHAVHAALVHRPEDVLEVRVESDHATSAWKRVVDLAQSTGRPVRLGRQELSRDTKPSGTDEGRRTHASALLRPRGEISLTQMLDSVDATGVWLALEHVQDPHNLGAIVRTAAFFGVKGLILTKDQSASLTAIAYDIAAGGVEAVQVTTVTNLSRTIDAAREAGLWTLGTSEHAADSVSAVEADRKWLVIVGNEERGLRRLTKDKCDMVVAIPCRGDASRGDVTSLNVSVATGIVLSQVAAS